MDISLSNQSLQDAKAIKKEVFLIEKLHLMFLYISNVLKDFSKIEFDV